MGGQTIVLTGAGSGMGAAMAKEFGKRGAHVAVLDLNEENGQNITEQISAEGGTARYYKVNVTHKDEIAAAAEDAEKSLGAITSWVNSAGVSRMVPFLDCTEELWDLTLDVNLKATFLCCQVAVSKMLKNGGGTILNMASLSGKKPSAWQTVYCASKSGVLGLTRSIAKEFADKNIRVNAICPGIVHTEMWDRLKYEYAKKRGLDPEEVLPYFEKNIPMRRLARMEDILQAAVFLLTDCSAYLTGQSLNLVGGEWMD